MNGSSIVFEADALDKVPALARGILLEVGS